MPPPGRATEHAWQTADYMYAKIRRGDDRLGGMPDADGLLKLFTPTRRPARRHALVQGDTIKYDAKGKRKARARCRQLARGLARLCAVIAVMQAAWTAPEFIVNAHSEAQLVQHGLSETLWPCSALCVRCSRAPSLGRCWLGRQTRYFARQTSPHTGDPGPDISVKVLCEVRCHCLTTVGLRSYSPAVVKSHAGHTALFNDSPCRISASSNASFQSRSAGSIALWCRCSATRSMRAPTTGCMQAVLAGLASCSFDYCCSEFGGKTGPVGAACAPLGMLGVL